MIFLNFRLFWNNPKLRSNLVISQKLELIKNETLIKETINVILFLTSLGDTGCQVVLNCLVKIKN